MSPTSSPWSSAIGPFWVQLRQSGRAARGDPFVYTLRITGRNADRQLQRRYTDFAALRSSLGARAAGLPEMPPKSLFKQRLSASFRRERADRLSALIVAVLSIDPFAIMPGIRQFLGLDAPTTRLMASSHELRWVLGLPSKMLLDQVLEGTADSEDEAASVSVHTFVSSAEENASLRCELRKSDKLDGQVADESEGFWV